MTLHCHGQGEEVYQEGGRLRVQGIYWIRMEDINQDQIAYKYVHICA